MPEVARKHIDLGRGWLIATPLAWTIKYHLYSEGACKIELYRAIDIVIVVVVIVQTTRSQWVYTEYRQDLPCTNRLRYVDDNDHSHYRGFYSKTLSESPDKQSKPLTISYILWCSAMPIFCCSYIVSLSPYSSPCSQGRLNFLGQMKKLINLNLPLRESGRGIVD